MFLKRKPNYRKEINVLFDDLRDGLRDGLGVGRVDVEGDQQRLHHGRRALDGHDFHLVAEIIITTAKKNLKNHTAGPGIHPLNEYTARYGNKNAKTPANGTPGRAS